MSYLPPILFPGPPTVNNDSASGFAPGAEWVDTIGKVVYFCSDASPGAAVWNSILGSTNFPIGSVYWGSNAVATVVITQNTWTRVAPVAGTLASPAVGFSRPANGRLRYTATSSGTLRLSCMFSLSGASPQDLYFIGLYKNGTVNGSNEYTGGSLVAGSSIRIKVGASGDTSSALTCIDTAAPNDYYELAVQNRSGAADPTFVDANIVAGGHT